jgi:hypothetical protein
MIFGNYDRASRSLNNLSSTTYICLCIPTKNTNFIVILLKSELLDRHDLIAKYKEKKT